MQFRMILNPKPGEYRWRGQRGVRGFWFDRFWYEWTKNPTTEGVCTQIATPGGCLPRDLWPEVGVGVSLGCEDAYRRGVRCCSARFTMTFAHYHEVDTTPRAVQIHVSRCVSDCLINQTEPVPPLHNEWLTSDVLALAHGINASAALDGLPALTDALLEAGCDDPLAIEHLTTCPDHGPMCWVVEMICAQAAARDGTSG